MSAHEFHCPACAAAINVADETLVEGNEVVCGECGEQFLAIREFDEASGATYWALTTPELDLEE